jgi:hypothetical protein
MIQPLRTAHRRAFVAIAFVLPVVLAAGLGARHRQSRSSVQAARLPDSAHLVRRSTDLWSKQAMLTEFYDDANHPGEISVIVRPAVELTEPDLLLYWSSELPPENMLSANARLLGPFVEGRPFTLPLDVDGTGYLVLFSLPHQTVLDSAKVEKLP